VQWHSSQAPEAEQAFGEHRSHREAHGWVMGPPQPHRESRAPWQGQETIPLSQAVPPRTQHWILFPGCSSRIESLPFTLLPHHFG